MAEYYAQKNDLISELHSTFSAAGDKDRAHQMSAYLKGKFPFFGIPAPSRRDLSRNFLKTIVTSPKPFEIIQQLFVQPEREFHYVAVEALYKCRKYFQPDTLHLMEWMITHNSWWDTVDGLASQSVGHYMSQYPENAYEIPMKWIKDPNMWIRRTALLFQLKYRDRTDTDLLKALIEETRHENEFFIRKAIGWALREYAKTNPNWVIGFVNSTELKPLSRKEALKHFQTE